MRAFLKSETAALHHKVEETLAAAAPLHTQHGYVQHLSIMLRFYHTLHIPNVTPNELPSRRACWVRCLNADLRELNVITDLPQETQRVILKTESCIGWAYVLEGSALGAQLLRQRVIKVHGASVPCRYFDFLADEHPGRWQSFLSLLETSDTPPALAAAGARLAFETLFNTITEQQHELC